MTTIPVVAGVVGGTEPRLAAHPPVEGREEGRAGIEELDARDELAGIVGPQPDDAHAAGVAPDGERASCFGESSASPAARTEAPLIDTSMIRTGIVISFTRPKRPCCLTTSSPTWSTGLRSPRRGTRPPGKLMDTAPIIPSAPLSDRDRAPGPAEPGE